MKKIRFLCFMLVNVLFILSLGFVKAASQPSQNEGNVNSKINTQNKIRLEFVRQYGGLNERDSNLLFYHPKDIEIDSDDYLYILDTGNYRIQIFDLDGKYVRTIGRKGQGPGEFQVPQSIELDDGDNIFVSDDRSLLMYVLNKSGDEIRRIRSKTFINYFRIAQDYIVVGSNKWNTGQRGMIRRRLPGMFLVPIIEIYNSTLEKEFEIEIRGKNYGNDAGMSQRGNRFFYSVDDKGFMYIAFEYQNRIEKYSLSGEKLIDIRTTKEFKESENPTRLNMDDGGYVYKINFFSKDIDIDKEGRIWVLSFIRQPSDEERIKPLEKVYNILQFEIFDVNGDLLDIIPWNYSIFGLHFRIFGDRLFVVDPTYEMAVYEYRIIEE